MPFAFEQTPPRLRAPSVARALIFALLCCLTSACKRDAGDSKALAQLAGAMNRGVSLMGQYQYEEAVQTFQEIVKGHPDLTDAKVNLAIALFNRNRKEDLELGVKVLDEVLATQPDNSRALYFKAIILQHVGKADQAIPLLEKVASQHPGDGAVWYILALCRQRVGQSPEADLLKAIERRPYLYSAHYQLYQTYMRAGNTEVARRYLEQFKKLRENPLGESIELPQYNQMGNLALATPLTSSRAPTVSNSRYQLKTPQMLLKLASRPWSPDSGPLCFAGAAFGDADGDNLADLAVPLGNPGPLAFARQDERGDFQDATTQSGLGGISNALACAFGDFDNDGALDLFVVCQGANRLFQGNGKGAFHELTQQAGLANSSDTRSAAFLDADHDGDLDIFLCKTGQSELWSNTGNTNFVRLELPTGLDHITACLAGDIDSDRDADLVLLREGKPARILLNQLLGAFTETEAANAEIHGDSGGALQDFNGDTLLDLVVLGGTPRELALFVGDNRGHFQPAASFSGVAKAATTRGALCGFRVVDIDLDGDLDILTFGPKSEVQMLLNDGTGQFVLQTGVFKPPTGNSLAALDAADFNGDLIPDLLAIEVEASGTTRAVLATGELSPPSHALGVSPSGIRSRDGRTRSPATPFGLSLFVRTGLREQRVLYTGFSGGASQSAIPAVFGLGGASSADFVAFSWPDAVTQVETALPAGQVHKVAELQRKISSCPVLFTWNGSKFEFITDFAGVGGLGYYSAPGVYAPPQVLEHIKIEPGKLQPRDGAFELRITEPMEETAYIDRLELLAIDHPAEHAVFPDERLAVSGSPPTHELLVVDKPLFPTKALDPQGRDCTPNLASVDRIYAYQPELDRRYFGFCRPHTLMLDFGAQLNRLAATDRLFLFIHGFIEYPYSQTVYAAAQSRLSWEPIRIEGQQEGGIWKTLVPDGGVPGGMARMMTVELTGLLSGISKLRLTTNLEVYYDQIFIAALARLVEARVASVPLLGADLRRVGFAREHSPDGRLPLIYDYELSDVSAPFHTLKGAYTRYGAVDALLKEYDDKYALVGPGDEIALRFDASRMPGLRQGCARSFILVSHAYCKDMDLYTGTSRTLAPLPFRGMSKYPYPETEHYPATEGHQAFLREYNTRLVE